MKKRHISIIALIILLILLFFTTPVKSQAPSVARSTSPSVVFNK